MKANLLAEALAPSLTTPTPLETNPRLSDRLGINLLIKRDDLLLFPWGGNKVRIVGSILRMKGEQEISSMVATGGVSSNLVRVVSLICAKAGVPCFLVLHGKEEESSRATVKLLRMLGAKISIVPPEGIEAEIERLWRDPEIVGESAFLFPGGGSSEDGAFGYVLAAEELRCQLEELGVGTRWIITPSGTGGTQAGLVVGNAGRSKVVGISVARSMERGKPTVELLVDKLASKLHLGRIPEVDFRDKWTCGGYEKTDPELYDAIRVAASFGLFLDPTYTGKAFWGLTEMVRNGEIQKGDTVVFWHTGGAANLMQRVGEL
ncbi:MAG TPA: pyridoxal-phosphate dependent enzyme [Vulgatibacter sp.]|nr:pyridoxal-phosphate dependent enzyme [Vulgatibacter sp.]